MIKDIKVGLKMMVYGLQFKTMIALLAIFWILGIFFELVSNDMGNIGGIYLVLCGSYFYQMVITSTVSTYVCSSAYKSKLQTVIPVVFSTLVSLFNYTIFALVRIARINAGAIAEDNMFGAWTGFLFVALLGIFLSIYNAVAYKYYVPSMIIMFVIGIPMVLLGMRGISFNLIPVFSNNAMYVILGYALIIAGGIISGLVSMAVKKAELDPKVYKTALARAGK